MKKVILLFTDGKKILNNIPKYYTSHNQNFDKWSNMQIYLSTYSLGDATEN